MPARGHLQRQVFGEISHFRLVEVINLPKLAAVVAQEAGGLCGPVPVIGLVRPAGIFQRRRRQIRRQRLAGGGNVDLANDPDAMAGLKRRSHLSQHGLDGFARFHFFPDQIVAVNGMVLQRRQRVPRRRAFEIPVESDATIPRSDDDEIVRPGFRRHPLRHKVNIRKAPVQFFASGGNRDDQL